MRPALLLPLLIAVLISPGSDRPARAGGPRAVNGLGQPMKWGAGTIFYHPDPGPLGLLSPADARALLAEAFAEWDATPAALAFSPAPALPVDVNGLGQPSTNPAHFRHFYRVDGDGRSPVIFDHDGSIIDALFGIGARFEVLGAAGIDNPIDGTAVITGASLIINGAFYDGVGLPDSPDDLTLEGLKAAMVHEIGHFINLDHSVLNHEQALDDNTGNDLYVPTMFPIAVGDEAALATLNPDDRRAAQSLYPTGGTDDISGSVIFGALPFQGAQVVLRRVGDPLMTAYSVISGGLFFPCNPPVSDCEAFAEDDPDRGAFAAGFLAPGSYRVCVEQIDRRFSVSNGTFVGPLATPPVLPGPEECFDASEGGASADDPDDAAAVGAGVSIALTLNALPAGDPLEPNDTLGNGSTLADLPGGADTVPAFLAPADVDVFNVPVTAGQRVRIDLDAAELGSTLDAVVGFYDAANTLVALSDDAVDPDTHDLALDPALEFVAGFTGTGKVVVSSYPDLDQNGTGGVSTGGYWLRVETTSDTDGDGAPDGEDICPATALDDADLDGLCFGADNCPTLANPGQETPFRLNGLLAGTEVRDAQFSPDGTTVVYLAQESDLQFDLYSVPAGGGGSTRLTISPPGSEVQSFRITPDGAHVVYLADHNSAGTFELHSIPIGGGPDEWLSGAMPPDGDVTDYRITPDSARVVYLADAVFDDQFGLYSVGVAGFPVPPSPVGLWDIPTGTGTVFDFLISPDSQFVVFRTDPNMPGQKELLVVPAAGPASQSFRLDSNNIDPAGVGSYKLSPDGSWAVYTADQGGLGGPQLYSVNSTGGFAFEISIAMAVPGGIQFQIAPDSSRVVYRADADSDGVPDLLSTPIVGGQQAFLSPPGGPPGAGVAEKFAITPDSARVVFSADEPAGSQYRLYSAPIAGGPLVVLTGSELALDAPLELLLSPDGSRAVFVQQFLPEPTDRLQSVPVAGGPRVNLSGGTVLTTGLTISADSSFVVYSDFDDLFAAPIAGGRFVHMARSGPGPILPEAISPDTSAVLYLTDTPPLRELFRVSPVFGGDLDGDGVLGGCDLCPFVSNAQQTDADGNGLGDSCQFCGLGTDPDGDRICGVTDNCREDPNPLQQDYDGDGAGDVCDTDDDNDGLVDDVETNTGIFAANDDTGTNPFDMDSDDDGVLDGEEVLQGSDPNSSSQVADPLHFAGRSAISGAVAGAAAVSAADFDRDGDLDVLSAGNNEILWHENSGAVPPAWTAHPIKTTLGMQEFKVAVADVDGDGDLDVLSASHQNDFVAWHENDGTPASGAWTERTIGSADGPTAVRAADLDRDGDLDVLATASQQNIVRWYENDGTPATGPWTIRTLVSTDPAPAALSVVDLDRDGHLDVVVASATADSIRWYESNGAFPPVFISRLVGDQVDGAAAVAAVDLDGDGDTDVISAAEEGDSIAWHENDGQTPPGWVPRTIAIGADGARAIDTADIDRDGDLDVLAASSADNEVAWYEHIETLPLPLWRRHPVPTTAIAPTAIVAADLDGDADLDLLGASLMDGTIGWHENRAIHQRPLFPGREAFPFSTANAGAFDVVAGDVDGDGDLDAVSAGMLGDRISWHENRGTAPWISRVLPDIVDGPEQIALADIDRDGDLDIVSVSYEDDTVAWFENDGQRPPTFAFHTIGTSGDGVWGLAVDDFDGDGDPDVVAASWLDFELTWYENDGTPGNGPWNGTVIDAPFNRGKRGLAAADMDGDGHVDILAVEVNFNSVRWYRNNGLVPPTFTQQAGMPNGGPGTPNYLAVGDINGDGHLDVAVAAYASTHFAWYEHNGAPSPSWTMHLVPTDFNGWMETTVADIDADGDQDLLSMSALTWRFRIMENDGAAAPSFTERTVDFGSQPGSFAPADVDGDGDLDLFMTMWAPHEVALARNIGGQFALKTALASGLTGIVLDGATVPVFAITLSSSGLPGDSPVELAMLQFDVTRNTGATLSSEEANRIFDRLRIHRDDGSGVFEPDKDPLIRVVETLELAPQRIAFAPGDPRVRVGAGESRTFFLVADVQTTASAQGIPGFRMLHVTDFGSQARDSASGALLRMAPPGGAIGTGTIALMGDTDAPFVESVFPPDVAVDVGLGTGVVLRFSEPVDPASAALGIALLKGGVKVAAAVLVDGATVSIDPDDPLDLDTDYVVQVTPALLDRDGNPALPYSSTFDTIDTPSAGTIDAGSIGGGAALPGNVADTSGFSTAVVGDVNGTSASLGIADLIIGAPNADAEPPNVDAGAATLVFGTPALLSGTGSPPSLRYATGALQDHVGETVAAAGDVNGDTIRDFFIGAPRSDQSGADAGVVYLVFGDPGLDEIAPATLDLDDLAACALPTLCGVKFLGAAPGDLAGRSLAPAGDVNGDGHADVLIGAPGSSPGGRSQAGRVYLVYGPLGPGVIPLANVGVTVPGFAFHGEGAGDALGAAVSQWIDPTGDGFDDLLFGAPGATVIGDGGATITDAGLVYAIFGGEGPGHLDDTATPGVIEASRVASGQPDQVAGMVFVGSIVGGNIGRSINGEVDVDGDGVYDIVVAGDGIAFVIPGDDPKTRVGSTTSPGTGGGGGMRTGLYDGLRDLGMVVYTSGTTDPLTAGAAGDIDDDGFDDIILGSPLADGPAGLNAGRAWIVLGAPAQAAGTRPLSDVGGAIAGFVVEGAAAEDQLGASVGGGADLNADGVDDGLIGAPFADPPAAPDAGETYVISPLRPEEVVAVTVSHVVPGMERVEWSIPPHATSFNVYRGLVSTLRLAGEVRTSDMFQFCGIPATSDADSDLLPDLDDPAVPPLGNALYYLVTARNPLGEGPLGSAGQTPPRLNDLQCP